jgi:hypothetical protein
MSGESIKKSYVFGASSFKYKLEKCFLGRGHRSALVDLIGEAEP